MSLVDASGCLTEAGIAAVTTAAPGQTPPELAAHLGACGRCQERLLAGGLPRPPRKAVPSAPPARGGILRLQGFVLVSILFFFWTLRKMIG
jgi:hypothetical protein